MRKTTRPKDAAMRFIALKRSALASIVLALVAGLALASLPALAQAAAKKQPAQQKRSQPQKPKVIGTFGDWQALTYNDGKGDVCYVVSTARKSEGHSSKPGETYIMVTHWPAQKNVGVVSVTAGFDYKKESDVELDVGSEKFNLFTQGTRAWAREGGDAKIVAAMKAGKDLTARGLTGKGGKTSDLYSLAGFSKAYEAASKACNVKG